MVGVHQRSSDLVADLPCGTLLRLRGPRQEGSCFWDQDHWPIGNEGTHVMREELSWRFHLCPVPPCNGSPTVFTKASKRNNPKTGHSLVVRETWISLHPWRLKRQALLPRCEHQFAAGDSWVLGDFNLNPTGLPRRGVPHNCADKKGAEGRLLFLFFCVDFLGQLKGRDGAVAGEAEIRSTGKWQIRMFF